MLNLKDDTSFLKNLNNCNTYEKAYNLAVYFLTQLNNNNNRKQLWLTVLKSKGYNIQFQVLVLKIVWEK